MQSNQVVYNPIPHNLYSEGKDRIIMRESMDKSRYCIGVSTLNDEGYYTFAGSIVFDNEKSANDKFVELTEKLGT